MHLNVFDIHFNAFSMILNTFYMYVGCLDFIFLVFGLVLGCLDLIFRCLDLYSVYCIPVLCVCIAVGCLYTCRVSVYLQGVCIPAGCDYGVRAPTRRGLCACRRRIFFLKKHAPGLLEHVFCGFCDF